jgi:uncharacterized protein (TIGR00725 family)
VLSVAIVGPGEQAAPADVEAAREVGALVAAHGWVTLTGGRDAGVMGAAAQGARASGGTVLGLLPGSDRSGASEALTVALPTGLGEARNAVLVTAADAVIACGISPGTLSEIALALRAERPTVLVNPEPAVSAALLALAPGSVRIADSAEDAVEWVAQRLERSRPN